ncbi:hypothetical protein ZWY2020_035761 [Hordeum vulgare]|nr:hypothetical protein ZWY2020_035761 [Hordeum vulgare]
MVVIHHGYNVLKMPGSGGIITIPYDEKDVVCTLERAYHAAATERSDDEEDELPHEDPRKKKKELLPMKRLETSGSVPGDGAMPPIRPRPFAHAGSYREYPDANAFMYFGQGNAVASYQRIQQAMLAPRQLWRR